MKNISELTDLSGRVALVTGASSGLGVTFARAFSAAGAKVALAARRAERLETLAAEIRAGGGEAFPVAMDVTKPESVSEAFDDVAEALGVPTILSNNAGVANQGLAHEATEDDWTYVVDTNLRGVWRVAKEAARRMIAAGQGGSIINTASILGYRPAMQLTLYSAAKAGVIRLTENMAIELARHQIRVNALAPGYFRTDMNRSVLDGETGARMLKVVPMRRFGEMDDLVGPTLLLASDAGAFMTGSTIVVDGGHVIASL